MGNTTDKIYMQRCLDLAALGLGTAAPNPMVGCVIVHSNKIIGEGYHQKCGFAHAEVNAINSVKNQDLLKESTLYVNLEPCAHYGKTPPCADLIIEKQIPHVVVGCLDTYGKVAGKGIEKLKQAGCQVEVGVLEAESRDLNRRFFTFHEKKRPYIILKWAQTIDGYIDVERKTGESAEPYWITNKLSKMLVHKWRTEERAFMVGANTVLNDNPQLTVREWNGRNPVRVIVDRNLSLSTDLQIFNSESSTIVFNEIKTGKNQHIHYIQIDFSKDFLVQLLNKLYDFEIQSLVVEGGRKLLNDFISRNLWDEARIFTGNKYFKNGTKSPDFPFQPIAQSMIGGCKLQIFRNS